MRRLSGHVLIQGVDDEYWPFKDETVTAHRKIESSISGPAVQLSVASVRWGGECRVEVDVSASLDPNQGIHISGEARLFEGTSEDSTDLEDTARIDFVVRPDTTRNRQFYLENRESGGGDHATVRFRLSNSADETGQ